MVWYWGCGNGVAVIVGGGVVVGLAVGVVVVCVWQWAV